MEETNITEVKKSPVGKTTIRSTKNKDGFVKGQIVTNEDLFKKIAQDRLKAKK